VAPRRERLFAARPQPKPQQVERYRATLEAEQEPAGGPWGLESFAERARADLRDLLRAARSDAAERTAELLADEPLPARELAPQDLETLRAEFPRVRRWNRSNDASLAHLSERLRQFCRLETAEEAPAGGGLPPLERDDVSLVSVERRVTSGAETRRTQVALRLGVAASGRRVQRNARWNIDWLRAGERWRVLAIEPLFFEEIDAPGALFAELGAELFARLPFDARERRIGVDGTYNRCDRLSGNSFIGGQGLALGDLDGDTLEDLYVPMHGGVPNKLYLQTPTARLREAEGSLRAAWLDTTRSALIVDLDGDGRSDLALAAGSRVHLFFGSAEGLERGPALACPGQEEIFSLASADPDRDGDLDLYACRYVVNGMIAGVPLPYFDARNGASNVYFQNQGGRTFEDATADVGLDHENNRFSLAALWEDLDGDGDLDLYVTNDFGRNSLYLNEQGRFRDVAGERGAEDRAAGMGISAADVDLDGHLDLYVSNMCSAAGLRTTGWGGAFADVELQGALARHARGNTLLLGSQDGRFRDHSEASLAAPAGWAWGGRFVDLDGDGWEDLVVPNGFITGRDERDVESFFWRHVVGDSPPSAQEKASYREAWAAIQYFVMVEGRSWNGRERNAAFLNLGAGRFADVGFVADLDLPDDSRAVVATDWDEDGRLDLFLKNRGAPRVRFLHNRGKQGGWIAFDLRAQGANPDAVGARVELEAGGRTRARRLYAGDGYLSQSTKRLFFGLGTAAEAKRVRVSWPDGSLQEFGDLPAGAIYRLQQGNRAAERAAPRGLGGWAALSAQREGPSLASARRTVLATKLPMAACPLPGFADPSRRLGALAGRDVLLTFWSIDQPASVEELGRLRARSPAWQTRLVSVCVDEGAALVRARKRLAQLGAESDAAFLDRDGLETFEVLWIEMFGSTESCLLPSSLLLDSKLQAVAAYFGPCDLEELEQDLATLGEMRTEARSPARLAGGQWLTPRYRGLRVVADVFQAAGRPELARFYRELRQE
jgi:hypothetical protein